MSIIEGWKFPIDVDEKTGKIKTVEDDENIKQSINIILKTEILERKIVNNFGSELRSFMFGMVNANYISSFKKSILSAIETWEEYASEVEVITKFDPGIVSKIEADVSYSTDFNPIRENVKRLVTVEDDKTE